MLDNIRIVLSHTSHPGNIGAAARAMKTMSLSRLYLVGPKQFPHADATARASGADDLLADAVVCEDLETAIAGCRLVFGSSARERRIPCPVLSPQACARRAVDAAADSEVALLFGCEQSGLSNEELDRCQALVKIPTSETYGSLNLAAAVQILCYELLVAERAGVQSVAAGEHRPATADDLERYYDHLEQVLVEIGFLDPDKPRKLMRRLRRLYNRAQPDDNEINILRGILTATGRARAD